MAGSVRRCNSRNLIVVCSLVAHLPVWLLELIDLRRCDYKHKKNFYRLHDQAEDEETKSSIHLRNMTIVLYIHIYIN